MVVPNSVPPVFQCWLFGQLSSVIKQVVVRQNSIGLKVIDYSAGSLQTFEP